MTDEPISTPNPDPEIDYKAQYESMKSEYDALKRNFDKTSSEVAEYKRKEKARMTDDEQKKAELAEREEHYKAIEKENALYKYKASLSNQIKDEKVLSEVAELYASGDISGAIAKQNEYFAKYQTELEKSIKADLLKQNPQATPQSDVKMSKEDIMKISDPVSRQQMIAQNIHLFK